MSNTEDAASRLTHLEEEGEVAADYLEELLDIMDFDGDIEIDVENDRPSVAIVSDHPRSSLSRLVGEDGEVLEALQELTRLAVQTSMGERSRLMLDVAGYRAARRAELQQIAAEAVEEVKETGRPVQLEPMNPFERKVCHDVAAEAGLHSESAGAEPQRCVVISLPDEEGEEISAEASAEAVDDGTGIDADVVAMEMTEEG